MAVVCWLLFDMLWGLVWPWAIICDLPHRPNSYIASSACAWLFLWHALGYTELSWSVVEPSAMALEAFGYGTWLFNLTNEWHASASTARFVGPSRVCNIACCKSNLDLFASECIMPRQCVPHTLHVSLFSIVIFATIRIVSKLTILIVHYHLYCDIPLCCCQQWVIMPTIIPY